MVFSPASIKAYAFVTLRSETYTSSGLITPLRLSPHHALMLLTQNTYSCSSASPIAFELRYLNYIVAVISTCHCLSESLR